MVFNRRYTNDIQQQLQQQEQQTQTETNSTKTANEDDDDFPYLPPGFSFEEYANTHQ
jgi:hypothetical protein